MDFVNLHGHSMFSFKDGSGTLDAHYQRITDLGMGAAAFTEHGNLSGGVKQEQAALKYGAKPIYGCELYTANGRSNYKWHLTVLAQNEIGYRNLSKLVTASYKNFFYWPTTTMTMLREYNEGLIVLSGCADSKIACDLLGGKGADPHPPDYAAARATAEKFQRLLGDRFYLETQAFPELDRSGSINTAYAQLSKDLGIPLVATCDVHYPHPDDNEIQKILHTIGRGKGTVSVAEAEWEYGIRLTYPESDRALLARLRGTGLTRAQARAALASTVEIGQRCEDYRLPRAEDLRYPTPDGQAPVDLFWDWLRDGWRYRAPNSPILAHQRAWAHERLFYETEVITAKGFESYLLTIADVIQWCKTPRPGFKPIAIGPGRGSAASSFVCWLLRITEINPLEHPAMMFERFIDPSRDDYPDIDIDIEDGRRGEVEQYLIGKYGPDHVGNVANITRFRGRSAVTSVAMAHDIPPWETAALRDRITDRPDGAEDQHETIADAIAMFPEAAEVIAKHPELDFARRLEGQTKALDVHAAGLVISTSTPLADVCAVYVREGVGKANRTVAQLAYDKWDVEYLGMLKLDMLGLSTMGMIADVLDAVGMPLDDLYTLPANDPETMDAFMLADVNGIFQFDGATTKSITREVRPTTMDELADINALSRPGPLFSGATEAYIAGKQSGRPIVPVHPLVDAHIRATHGQIIYQEQYLAIVRDLGGFDSKAVGDIRRAIGKKKGVDAFNKLREQFFTGARANGAGKETSERIWAAVLNASGYAFNIPHAAAYALIAYWCQYLKQHYPIDFYKAMLVRADKADWPKLVRDARAHRVQVRGLDLADSGASWEVRANDRGEYIRAGWTQVDGIGDATMVAIEGALAERGRGFESWEDLLSVKGIGPVTVRKTREAAEANDPAGIKAVARSLAAVKRQIENDYEIPLPTHTSSTFPTKPEDVVVWFGIVAEIAQLDEVDETHRRTGESHEAILADLKDPHLRTSVRIKGFDDGDDQVTLRINRWKYPRHRETVESLVPGDFVVVEGARKSGIYKTLHVGRMWVFDAPGKH